MAAGLESQGQVMAATGDSLMSVVWAWFAPCSKDYIRNTSNINICHKSYMIAQKVVLSEYDGVYISQELLTIATTKQCGCGKNIPDLAHSNL